MDQDENRLIAERRGKLDARRVHDDPFPNDFRKTAVAAELACTYGHLENEVLEERGVTVSVAGRMMAKRVMGKASFIKLQDRSGQIQIRLERDRLPEGEALVKRLAALGPGEIDRRDGLKWTGGDAWVHVRPSNTEAVVRVIAEAKDEAAAVDLINRVRSAT